MSPADLILAAVRMRAAATLVLVLTTGCGGPPVRADETTRDAADGRDDPVSDPGDAFDGCRGEITPTEARTVISASAPDVQACYQSALRDDPTLALRLVLTVRVAWQGNVDAVRVEGAPDHASLIACVRGVAERMTFQPIAGGGCGVVQVPFALRPR